MKIKMRAQITGTRDGVEWPAPGTVVDLPDDEATSLLAQRLAEPVTPESETASVTAPETATTPKPRARARKAED